MTRNATDGSDFEPGSLLPKSQVRAGKAWCKSRNHSLHRICLANRLQIDQADWILHFKPIRHGNTRFEAKRPGSAVANRRRVSWDSPSPWQDTPKLGLSEYNEAALRGYCERTGDEYKTAVREVMASIRRRVRPTSKRQK